MRVVRRILTPLVAIVLGLAAFGLAVRIYMGREAENRIAPSEAISIAELHSPLPKPGFLFCPPGYCPAAEAIASPVFPLPWERLHEYWTEVVSGEKLVETIAAVGFSAPDFANHGPFDLVLANILANPLRQMATPMATHLAASAQVILSGLLPHQAQGVIAAYRARGLVLERHLIVEGWSSLLMRYGE